MSINGKGGPRWNQRDADEVAFIAAAGVRFSRRRKESGLSLEALAQRIGSRSSVLNRFELGRGTLGLHKLAKACIVFNCSVDSILGLDRLSVEREKIEVSE